MKAAPHNRPAVPDGTTVLLLEGDTWRRNGLAQFLRAEGYVVLFEESPETTPHLALVDFRGGIRESGARYDALRAKYPEMKTVAFVTAVNSATVFPCLLLGVKGVLPAEIGGAELLLALAAVREGSLWAPRAVLSQSIDRIATLGFDDVAHRALQTAEGPEAERRSDEPSGSESSPFPRPATEND